MTKRPHNATPIAELERTVAVFRDHGRSQVAAARVLGINASSLRNRLGRAVEDGLIDAAEAFPGRLTVSPEELEKTYALLREHGTKNAVRKVTGLSGSGIDGRVTRLKELGYDLSFLPSREAPDVPLVEGQVEAQAPAAVRVKRSGRRFILTGAQNNTALHEGVWASLNRLAEHYGAKLLVSPFTYNKARYGSSSVKPGSVKKSDTEDLWYPEQIKAHMCIDALELADGLIFRGDAQIEATAANPLSGLETHTGAASGIFPATKFAMASVPTQKHQPAKFNFTTGVVSQRNYIQKKSGQKAEFHHGYGAVIAETDSAGDWFVRQLNATDDGVVCDLDVRVEPGKLTTGNRVEGITWGDIHNDSLEDEIRAAIWGDGGILDTLKPHYQFAHDLVDMRSRNHHDRDNPHQTFQRFVEGRDSVDKEIARAAEFLKFADRSWCETVVVDSNHDQAVERWLREANYRADPPNAIFFLRAQLEKYRAIERGDAREFHLIEWALRRAGCPSSVRFLREDESFVICPDAGGGIECGMHGHRGPHGSRGTPANLSKTGSKANIGDKHSAGIYDGLYVAGLTGAMEQGYNKGPSGWSRSHTVTYKNGKRSIVTMRGPKYRAA